MVRVHLLPVKSRPGTFEPECPELAQSCLRRGESTQAQLAASSITRYIVSGYQLRPRFYAALRLLARYSNGTFA
jgi:hypothetical protein